MHLLVTLHEKQGNQRWQIPRPPHASAWQRSPPLQSKMLIFFCDVISLLTQEVPMNKYLKEIVSPVFEIRH